MVVKVASIAATIFLDPHVGCLAVVVSSYPIRLGMLSELNSSNKVNTVHVRDQKHELTPPRNRYSEKVTALPSRVTVYKQAEQLFGLRHKPITLQDALPRSDSSRDNLPRPDPLSLVETSPLSSS
ncbi:hypothetical protein GQ457_17G013220 [Hibiscus cannabinus]